MSDEAVIPFAPRKQNAATDSDPLDNVGKTVLGLLHRAAEVADANSQRTLDRAHKLSAQLRAAEDHIKELEADVRYYHDRAERAEKWLQQIAIEIERRFLNVEHGRSPTPPQGLLRRSKDT